MHFASLSLLHCKFDRTFEVSKMAAVLLNTCSRILQGLVGPRSSYLNVHDAFGGYLWQKHVTGKLPKTLTKPYMSYASTVVLVAIVMFTLKVITLMFSMPG